MSDNNAVKDPRNMEELYKTFEKADFIIRKNYRTNFADYPVCNVPKWIMDVLPEKSSIASNSGEESPKEFCPIGDNVQFFQISKLVYDKNENIQDKLTTVYHSMTAYSNTSVLLMIKSDENGAELYMGIADRFESSPISTISRGNKLDTLKLTFESNFPGSTTVKVLASKNKELIANVFQNANAVSCVTGLASFRNENEKENSKFVQGLEKLIDAMRGKRYTALFIADCKGIDEIEALCGSYEDIYAKLSPFAQSQQTIGRTDGVTDTDSFVQGVVDTTNESISDSLSHSHTIGKSTSNSVGITVGGKIPDSVPLVGGANLSGSYNRTWSKNEADTDSETKTTTKGTAKSLTTQNSVSKAISTTTNDGLQITFQNRAVKSLLDLIDEKITHLRACEAYGVFDFGCYFIAEDKATATATASVYDSLMRGEKSYTEASAINTWGKEYEQIFEYLKRFYHPLFAVPTLFEPVKLASEAEKQENSDDKKKQEYKYETLIVTPTTIVSGKDLALHMGLPKKAVSGVPIVECAEFGRNPISTDEKIVADFKLGSIYHMQKVDEKTKVGLNGNSLTGHTFVTGSTGSGKSNTIYNLLNQLHSKNAKYLVIEPAKGEYKNVFGKGFVKESNGLAPHAIAEVYGTNPNLTKLLRINPFSFPKEIHIYEHMDRLVEIFNACWPMYAAMPAVLKDAIERAYQDAGWNLRTSKNKYDQRLFPNFSDVLRQVEAVMEESQYSADSKGDYKGALSMRLKSLTNGINGLIFTADEIPAKELFDENVIVDISRIGSTETKALIMGLLVMKLQEHRMVNHGNSNEDLKHVTVLEEAHTLLKRTSTEQIGESANLLGKSVEMITNAIAEMRTYGEGFIIADQSPGLLDMAVIRNTNTKIILRLPEYSDRELVGKAASLNDDQIDELAKLKRGVASVYQNDWIEAVLCSVDHFKCPTRSGGQCNDTYSPNNLKGDLISRFIAKDLYRLIDSVDRERIITADISAKAKCKLFDYMLAEKSKRDELAAGIAFDLFDCGSVISKMKPELTVENRKNYLFKYLKAELSPLADNYINLILCLVTYWIVKEAPNVPEAALLADIVLKETESRRFMQ